MEKLNLKAKQDNKVMYLLKLTDIAHVIAQSNKGTLVLSLPYKGIGKDYRFLLDSVPVSDETNTELLEVLKDNI